MPVPKRVQFQAIASSFASAIANAMSTDPNWDVSYNVTTPTGYNGTSYGSAIFKNKKEPTLYFMVNVNFGTGAYNRFLQFGMYEGTGVNVTRPDVMTDSNLGYQYTTLSFSATAGTLNPNYMFTVLSTDDFIFIHGVFLDGAVTSWPFRLYLGRLKPFANEDPLISKDFVGIFGHHPLGNSSALQSDANTSNYNYRTAGSGIVRKSKNGTKYAVYDLFCNSQLVNPATDGSFLISPFYVGQQGEGIRGEFSGLRVTTVRDSSLYPDGSILDLGTDKYYVMHDLLQGPPPGNYANYPPNNNLNYTALNNTHYARYYFTDGFIPLDGQRVFLVKI